MIIAGNNNSRNKSPFFTIITVVKNGDQTLERCIKSIKHQTFQDFEYLIIDGASSDKTHKIIKQNSGIVDYAISEKDEELYFAMNKMNLIRLIKITHRSINYITLGIFLSCIFD